MNPEKADMSSGRDGINITLGGMALNIGLSLVKFLGGIYGGSKALIADSLHSLSDLISDVLALVGLHYRHKGSDYNHPYGHGKIESLTTIGVGILLFGIGLWIGFDAARSLIGRTFSPPSSYTVWIAAFSIVSKETIYRLTVRTAGRIRSDVLKANAWHHRTDAITSGIIVLSIAGASFFPRLAFLDSAAAVLVSVFIIVISIDIMKKSIDKVIDSSLSDELKEKVRTELREVEGVLDVHDISGRYYADIIRMEAHIEVAPEITVAEGHRIAESAEERIITGFEEISSVLIHIDPFRENGEAYSGGPDDSTKA
jgi:cation diffusion facilitator family transporter